MKKRILIIDDEENIVFAIKTFLEEYYEVFVTYSGRDGLEQAKKEKPDLILLDVMLPEIDGPTINQKLKEEEGTRDIPVIVTTANLKVAHQLFKDKAKVDGYFEKPFELDALLESIKSILKETK